MVIALLVSNGYLVETRKIDNKTWTVADLRAQVPDARSVPQVFIDGDLVGGYNDVVKFLDANL